MLWTAIPMKPPVWVCSLRLSDKSGVSWVLSGESLSAGERDCAFGRPFANSIVQVPTHVRERRSSRKLWCWLCTDGGSQRDPNALAAFHGKVVASGSERVSKLDNRKFDPDMFK